VGDSDLILVIVVITALAFDFTNGFHDTANVVATSISTRAMAPRLAVAFAALLNFVGAFVSLTVAATVGKGIVEAGSISTTVVFAGLIGAIAWNLITWYFGLPSSSSHALIGGVVGAAFVADGAGAIKGDGLLAKIIIPALIALVSVPVFTGAIPPDEYGAYFLITSAATLVSSVAIGWLASAAVRHFVTSKNEGRLDAYMATVVWTALASLVGAALLSGALVWAARGTMSAQVLRLVPAALVFLVFNFIADVARGHLDRA